MMSRIVLPKNRCNRAFLKEPLSWFHNFSQLAAAAAFERWSGCCRIHQAEGYSVKQGLFHYYQHPTTGFSGKQNRTFKQPTTRTSAPPAEKRFHWRKPQAASSGVGKTNNEFSVRAREYLSCSSGLFLIKSRLIHQSARAKSSALVESPATAGLKSWAGKVS